MSWFKHEPKDLPEWCQPNYVCLTLDQAESACFSDRASTGGIAFAGGFLTALLLITFAVWAVGRLARRL